MGQKYNILSNIKTMIYERTKLMLNFHKMALKENKKTSETRRKYLRIESLLKTCVQNLKGMFGVYYHYCD